MSQSTTFHIRNWCAWAPGVDTPDAWREWCAGDRDIADSGTPRVDFLPANFRRRLSRVSKMALAVAFRCLEEAGTDPAAVRSVFASRYGDVATTLGLLHDIVAGEPLSPTRFSLSVHNASSGLFTIAAKNHHPSTAVSGRRDTFMYGILEAAGMLRHTASPPVLVVMTDEPLPEMYAAFRDGDEVAYAIALLLCDAEPGMPVSLDHRSGTQSTNVAGEPECQALSFVRWLLSDKSGLTLSGQSLDWSWQRPRTDNGH